MRAMEAPQRLPPSHPMKTFLADQKSLELASSMYQSIYQDGFINSSYLEPRCPQQQHQEQQQRVESSSRASCVRHVMNRTSTTTTTRREETALYLFTPLLTSSASQGA